MNVISYRGGSCEPRTAFAVPGLLHRFLTDPSLGGANPVDEGTLALDISETPQDLIVRASLPGFSKDQIDVEVHDGVLTIKAQVSDAAADPGETYLRRERRSRSAHRRLALPSTVEGSRADAELKDGVLTLRLAKTPEAQPRKVAIR